MRRRGGALINLASALADRAIPLQGNYCAAKHAVKAFTDALRMEVEEEGVPVAVTLIKPASIDTPFFEKARTYFASGGSTGTATRVRTACIRTLSCARGPSLLRPRCC